MRSAALALDNDVLSTCSSHTCEDDKYIHTARTMSIAVIDRREILKYRASVVIYNKLYSGSITHTIHVRHSKITVVFFSRLLLFYTTISEPTFQKYIVEHCSIKSKTDLNVTCH